MKCRIQISTSNPPFDVVHVETACQIEFDIDALQAPGNPSRWEERVIAAMRACRDAVDREIASRRGSLVNQSTQHHGPAEDCDRCKGQRKRRQGRSRRHRRRHRHRHHTASESSTLDGPAASSQRRSINTICLRLGLEPRLAAENHHFHLDRLTARHASMLIRQLSQLNDQPRLREYMRASAPVKPAHACPLVRIAG